jgi:hypothetical protein
VKERRRLRAFWGGLCSRSARPRVSGVVCGCSRVVRVYLGSGPVNVFF